MNKLSYTKEQIESVLNIINTLPFTSFQNANKLVEVFNILNSPIKEDIKKEKDVI